MTLGHVLYRPAGNTLLIIVYVQLKRIPLPLPSLEAPSFFCSFEDAPSCSTLVLAEVCQDCKKKTGFVEARLVVRDRSIFYGSKEKEGIERARSGKLVGVEAEELS
jgi:hypothetical protein